MSRTPAPTVVCPDCNGDSRGYFVPKGTSGYFVRCRTCDSDGWLFAEDAAELALDESKRIADDLSVVLDDVRAGRDIEHCDWFQSFARAS